MEHIFIIRKGQDDELIETIACTMAHYHYQIRFTKTIEDAYAIAYEYASHQKKYRIYVCGGDGMVHLVANALAFSLCEMVVIPRGTGNDFARTIYHQSYQNVIEESLHWQSQCIDLIQVNDFYSINCVCCGLDAKVANAVHDLDEKSLIPKKMQYNMSVFKQVRHLEFYPTSITSNKDDIYNGDVVICAFCNGQYFGGGFHIGKQADIQSGLIDLNIIGGIKKRELPLYLWALFRQKLDHKKGYYHDQKPIYHLTSNQYLNVDGEKYEPGQYILQKKKEALWVVMP